MDEVRRLGALKDAEINEAKKVLAYEVTKIIHGEEEAIKAKEATEKGMDPKLVEKKYFGAKQDSEPWQKRAAKIGNINL